MILGVFEFFIFYLIKMNKKKRPQTATDDVRTMGGKEVVLNRMVNHYKALASVKAKVEITPPYRFENKKQCDLVNSNYGYNLEMLYDKEFHNVRQTYKGVSNVKTRIDSAKPFTYNMARNIGDNTSQKEKFEDMEHIRRLNAMSKRILSIGKVCCYILTSAT
jgi:hypothetical protein